MDRCFVFAGEGYARKIIALIEYFINNTYHRIWNRYGRKVAIGKCTKTDASYTIWYYNIRKGATVNKCSATDYSNLGSNFDGLRIVRPIKFFIIV